MRTSGYIALVSVIIISFVAMVTVFALSLSGFFVRSNISDSYLKETANALSESCVHTAILRLIITQSYTGNETINVGTDTCTIQTIQTSGSTKIIQTKAVYQKATTNYKVVVNTADASVASWEELATL